MGSLLSIANSDFSSIVSYFFCYIGNYFGHCRIYKYKMKTDLKTGSYPNGSTTTEPSWTVPDSSATYYPYGHENKENTASLYNSSCCYTTTNNIILHKQKYEFAPSGKNCIDRSEKSPETSINGLKKLYQPSDKISDLSTHKNSPSTETNYSQNNTFLFSIGQSMTCKTIDNNSDGNRSSPDNSKNRHRSPNNRKDCVSSWSNIFNKMPKIKDMKNRPVDNNTRCPDKLRQQNNAPRSSFTQLQKNIQEAVRNFSWWTSGYVHENLNCFNRSRAAPLPHQNRGQHLCHRTSPQSLDHYYYRPQPVPEMRYPCRSTYIPPFCYSPERHCPQRSLNKEHPGFCVVNPTVGQVCYPSSSYITKGNGWATTKRPCLNKKNGHISKSDWSKSKRLELFEKTHWFSETAKENYKSPSVQKVNYSTPKQIEVYSILVNDLQPSVPSVMSPVNCDDTLPSTLYSNHQEETTEKTKICDSPEASMFSPVHWPVHLALDLRQMLDRPQVVNINKENRLETGSDLSDYDDDDDDSLSDMVLNNGPSSSKDDLIDYVMKEIDEVEDKEKSKDDDKKLEDADFCGSPSSPHRNNEDENESDDSGDESDSDSDDDLEVDGITDCELSDDGDLEMDSVLFESKVNGLSNCEDSDDEDDDLEVDGGSVLFELPASTKDYQKSVCPIELELSIVEDDSDETDGGPITFGLSVREEFDFDEVDGGPAVNLGYFADDLETDDGSKLSPLCVSEACPRVNNWLIKPDSDCDDSDEDAFSKDDDDDDDDWDTTWSKSCLVVPPCEEDLMDEFNNFTLFNCTFSCEAKTGVLSAFDEVDAGYSQKIKEANERWNQIYNDQDFTPKENHPKKVQFATGKNFSILHHMVCWTYAYRAARKGPWISLALDSERFRKRINELKTVIDPILDPVHRQKVYASRQAAEKNT